jgi:hypothetical protein
MPNLYLFYLFSSKLKINFSCTYLLSSLVSASIFTLRVSVFVDCFDGIHRLSKSLFINKNKSNQTYLTADISEVFTLPANANATSVKCGICVPFN